MKRLLLSMLLTCFALSPLFAQKLLPASLTLKDGKVLQGQIDLPASLKVESIRFKPQGSADLQTYPNEELASFTLNLAEKFTFDYLSQVLNPKSGKTWKHRWYFRSIDGYAKMYVEGDRVDYKEKKNVLVLKETSEGIFTYCLRMGEEPVIRALDNDIQPRSMLKYYYRWAAESFADSPETLALIEQMKKEKRYSLAELVETYNAKRKG